MQLFDLLEQYDRTDWTEKLLLTDDQSADAAKGRKMVLDIMHTNLTKSSSGIHYLINDLNRFGLKLKDWPEISEWINSYKRTVLKDLMNSVKNNPENGRFFLNRLYDIGIDWPELAVIQQDIDRRIYQLSENSSLFSNKIQKILDKYKKTNSPGTVRFLINDLRSVGLNETDIKLVVRQELPVILNNIKPTRDTWKTSLGSLGALEELLGNQPVLNDMFEKITGLAKDDLIRSLNSHSTSRTMGVISQFDPKKYPEVYREMLVQAKNTAVKLLKNTVLSDRFDYYIFYDLVNFLKLIGVKIKLGDALLDTVLNRLSDHLVSGTGNTNLFLHTIQMLADDYQEKLVQTLNKHKTHILKEMLADVKLGFLTQDRTLVLIKVLEHLGIHWRELEVIKNNILKKPPGAHQ